MAVAAGKYENGFPGRTPHQLALQIADYNKNGHKNKERLLNMRYIGKSRLEYG
jgi:hypothetical protein